MPRAVTCLSAGTPASKISGSCFSSVRAYKDVNGAITDPRPYLKYLEIGKIGASDGTATRATIAPSRASTTTAAASRVSRTASYDSGGAITIPMPVASGGRQGQTLVKEKVLDSEESSLIDVVNSYHTAQLMANLYKQG